MVRDISVLGIYSDISLWSERYHDISLNTGLYVKHTLVNPFDLRCQSGKYACYNTGKGALPDIYACCPRASSVQGQACIYVSGKARAPVL